MANSFRNYSLRTYPKRKKKYWKVLELTEILKAVSFVVILVAFDRQTQGLGVVRYMTPNPNCLQKSAANSERRISFEK